MNEDMSAVSGAQVSLKVWTTKPLLIFIRRISIKTIITDVAYAHQNYMMIEWRVTYLENSVRYSEGSFLFFMWKLTEKHAMWFPVQEVFKFLMNHFNFSNQFLLNHRRHRRSCLLYKLHSCLVPQHPLQTCLSPYIQKTLHFVPVSMLSKIYQGNLEGILSWNSRALLYFKIGWSRGSRKHKELGSCFSLFSALPHICF